MPFNVWGNKYVSARRTVPFYGKFTSFAVLLASTALFANAATTAPHFISGDVVIDSSDFQKPATDKYNIDYYKIVNGNQLTFTGSGNTSGSLTVRNDDNDRVNSYFFASGSATKIIFSKFNTFNVLTDTKFTHYVFHNDESDLTKDTGPNDQTPFILNWSIGVRMRLDF